MTKKIVLLLCCINLFATLTSQTLPKPDDIINIMRRVGDFQMAQPWPLHLLKTNPYATGPKSWVAGAYYPGIVCLYHVTNDQKYLSYLLDVGNNNKWEQGARLLAADDQAILQTYLDLYNTEKKPEMLTAAKKTLGETMKTVRHGYVEWDWSDALFMAPPVWPHLSKITGDISYLDYMNRMWWEAVDSLYSTQHHLFFRDRRFKTMTSLNGQPVFWSRGNGWVAAGMVRILDNMPVNYPSRPRYEALLKEFAAKLKDIQQPDGFWKASLLDPAEYPFGETSGTVFFCYMMAWGINNQLLEKDVYLPVVVRAWNAVASAVHQNGLLGYAQPGGDRPYKCEIDHPEPYACGGFLMCGKEMLQLIKNMQ